MCVCITDEWEVIVNFWTVVNFFVKVWKCKKKFLRFYKIWWWFGRFGVTNHFLLSCLSSSSSVNNKYFLVMTTAVHIINHQVSNLTISRFPFKWAATCCVTRRNIKFNFHSIAHLVTKMPFRSEEKKWEKSELIFVHFPSSFVDNLKTFNR